MQERHQYCVGLYRHTTVLEDGFEMNDHLCFALQIFFKVGDIFLKGNGGHVYIQLKDIILLLKLFY